MGVITGTTPNGRTLAPFGIRLAALRNERPELLGDALHLRLATLYIQQPHARFSFAYAAIADWLWDRGDTAFKDETRSELVGVVIERAAQTFGVDAGTIAFSKTSVSGAAHWLEATSPPVLSRETGRFKRRHSVPALCVLWAIDALYRAEGVAPGTRLSLTEERRTRLCQWLLLDPDAFTAILPLVARTEGVRKTATQAPWLTLGTEGGFGKWCLLAATCPIGATAPGANEPDTDTSDIPDDDTDDELEN
jgi:hypothetical protein